MTHAISGREDELCDFSMTRILIEYYYVFCAVVLTTMVSSNMKDG